VCQSANRSRVSISRARSTAESYCSGAGCNRICANCRGILAACSYRITKSGCGPAISGDIDPDRGVLTCVARVTGYSGIGPACTRGRSRSPPYRCSRPADLAANCQVICMCVSSRERERRECSQCYFRLQGLPPCPISASPRFRPARRVASPLPRPARQIGDSKPIYICSCSLRSALTRLMDQ
jgi:hypothetical protein